MILIRPKFSVVQDNVELSIHHANKGEGLPKHEHVYSHLTICCAGSIILRKEGRELVMTANTQPVNLIANEWHEIEAMEDNTVFINVFSSNKY